MQKHGFFGFYSNASNIGETRSYMPINYTSFGSPMFGRTYQASSTNKYRYGFNGKEKDNEINVDGGSYDFGARIYDGRLGRWCSTDKKESKYPSFSPYNFSGNNPIFIIDPNGNDIIPYHVTKIDEVGIGKATANELSQKTYDAIKDILKTPDGLAFFSQFAKKGQTLAGHTFTENGILSNNDLIIEDWSLENSDDNDPTGINACLETVYDVGKNNLKFTIPIMSKGKKMEDIEEILLHEIGLHGYLVNLFSTALLSGKQEFDKQSKDQEKNNPKGAADHESHAKKDTKSKAHNNYITLRDQLINVSSKFAKICGIKLPIEKTDPIKRNVDSNNTDKTAVKKVPLKQD